MILTRRLHCTVLKTNVLKTSFHCKLTGMAGTKVGTDWKKWSEVVLIFRTKKMAKYEAPSKMHKIPLSQQSKTYLRRKFWTREPPEPEPETSLRRCIKLLDDKNGRNPAKKRKKFYWQMQRLQVFATVSKFLGKKWLRILQKFQTKMPSVIVFRLLMRLGCHYTSVSPHTRYS